MEARRSSTALRPPMAARANSLKRTISKCGLDAAGGSANDLSGLAAKKLAPLQEPKQPQIQQLEDQHEAAIRRQHLHYYQQQQQQQRASVAFEDDGDAVLLPRHALPFAPPYDAAGDDFCADAHEYSPVAPFHWDDSPQSAKHRYYESVLEASGGAFASPSPQHVLYACTPGSGRSTDSTVSFGGSSSAASLYSPFAAQTVASGQQQALEDRVALSAANLHAIMLSYLDEMFQYYDLARSFTFGRVSEMVQSVPFAFKYMQGLVKNRLGISWHLVGSFVENVLAFICDEDIRDASVKEFADFLRSIQAKLYESPAGNIFLNLYEFFQHVLVKFKTYLIQHWLAVQRIQFPCEFGKKSSTLFLCMECHREHF